MELFSHSKDYFSAPVAELLQSLLLDGNHASVSSFLDGALSEDPDIIPQNIRALNQAAKEDYRLRQVLISFETAQHD